MTRSVRHALWGSMRFVFGAATRLSRHLAARCLIRLTRPTARRCPNEVISSAAGGTLPGTWGTCFGEAAAPCGLVPRCLRATRNKVQPFLKRVPQGERPLKPG